MSALGSWEPGLPEPEERRRILNEAKLTCNRAKSLIETLDAFSRQQTLQRNFVPDTAVPAAILRSPVLQTSVSV